MHELSIAQSIVEAVEAKATECNAVHVKSVRLKIGEASSIVIDSLTFCFEMLTSLDPTLTGAQLLIDTVPHLAQCRHCNKEFAVVNFVAQCPTMQRVVQRDYFRDRTPDFGDGDRKFAETRL
jgi:hydrogenase nickel incorporation protein HypA/HybF